MQAEAFLDDQALPPRATLDAATRRLALPGGEQVLLSDTVGFIKKLPHQLVESFRSTLEEVGEVDLLVHVVDASAADVEGQMVAVRSVLAEIGAGEVPEQVVFNKTDAVSDGMQTSAHQCVDDGGNKESAMPGQTK